MIRRCDEITIFPDLNLSLNDPDLSASKCHNATGTLWHTTQPSNRDFESKEWGRSTITGTRYLWRFESTFGSQVDEAAMLEISGKWVCLKVIYHDLPQNWSMLRDLPLKITNICWVLHDHITHCFQDTWFERSFSVLRWTFGWHRSPKDSDRSVAFRQGFQLGRWQDLQRCAICSLQIYQTCRGRDMFSFFLTCNMYIICTHIHIHSVALLLQIHLVKHVGL